MNPNLTTALAVTAAMILALPTRGDGGRSEHWALQPLRRPVVPSGAGHPIDAFISARLASNGLALAPNTVTVDALVTAVTAAADDAIRRRALEVADSIRTSGGAHAAVDAIRDLLNPQRNPLRN